MKHSPATGLANILKQDSGESLNHDLDSIGIHFFNEAKKMEVTHRANAIRLYRNAVPYLNAELEGVKKIDERLDLIGMLRECYVKLRGEALMEGYPQQTLVLPHDAVYYDRQVSELDTFLANYNINLN